jgi:hypothetical protein
MYICIWMQIRGGDGAGLLQGCLDMRVAYDPGTLVTIFVITGLDF